MYFPFHLMRTANAVQTAWPARPLREADLPGARAIADEVLERFPRDWAHIVRSEIRTSIIAAVLPLAGALLFGWLLILLTLSVLLDGLALWRSRSTGSGAVIRACSERSTSPCAASGRSTLQSPCETETD